MFRKLCLAIVAVLMAAGLAPLAEGGVCAGIWCMDEGHWLPCNGNVTCLVDLTGGGGGGGGNGDVPGLGVGPAAVMTFDGSGGKPSVASGPGWSCDDAFPIDGDWETDCFPDSGPQARAKPIECENPFAIAGGTPVTTGWAEAKVGCAHGIGNECSTSWTGSGACVSFLLGNDGFPLRCVANVIGSAIGGTLFATCGNGLGA
ncbi:MAG: hypothetical protein QOE90_1864 [Thermoplasmata archaeon]|nr:hypothetical protein [Thermoplasmata archaeon]